MKGVGFNKKMEGREFFLVDYLNGLGVGMRNDCMCLVYVGCGRVF